MMLACPACDSRYDVTGHAIGQKVRCRCGVMMTILALPPSADELGCPHCGACVAPTARTCPHCSAELAVEPCPRCQAHVFHGHPHCPDCGAELAITAIASAQSRACPRCTTALHARRIDDIVIDECRACQGVFLDHVAIKRVIVDRAQSRAEALLGALPRSELNPLPAAGQKMYLPCPVCRVVMNRRLFASGTGIIVDVCRAHGTFFDAGELPLIIDFVRNGGLDKSARRGGGHVREAARPEPAHTHAAPLPVARLHRDTRSGAGSALVELLAALFG